MMEATIMHSGLYLSSNSVEFIGRTGNNGIGAFRLKSKGSAGFSSSFGGARAEFSSRSSPASEWHSLHLHSPKPRRSCAGRVNYLGQRTFQSAQPIQSAQPTLTLIDEKTLLVEEELKLVLKRKGAALNSDLRGISIFLVGMMGSGKSTVGKHVSDALGYHFYDSDKVIEDTTGVSIKQMFREGKEEEFRNAESEVIMQLSSQLNVVVATGGGAVVRPQNWGYLRQGITVWLDVPVEALAARVCAVGCESRPLLGQVSAESAYVQALTALENLFEERESYYKNADASVCVSGLAAMMGLDSIAAVTPTMLAIQVLEEISSMIRKRSKQRNKRRDRLGNI